MELDSAIWEGRVNDVPVSTYPRADVADSWDLEHVTIPTVEEPIRKTDERNRVRAEVIQKLVTQLMNTREMLLTEAGLAYAQFNELPEPEQLVREHEINPQGDAILSIAFSIWESLHSSFVLNASASQTTDISHDTIVQEIDTSVSTLLELAA